MERPPLGIPESDKPTGQRLDSWKEIAAYLNRDVTTVQRWEKREGMPVHRHLHDRRGSVYALPTELDTWMQSRRAGLGEEGESELVEAETPIVPRITEPVAPGRPKSVVRKALVAG